MKSKLAEALGLSAQPVALLRMEQPPTDAWEPSVGWHGCVIALLAAAANGKRSAFREETVGCPGGKGGLALAQTPSVPLTTLLAGGSEKVPGLRYKKNSALVEDYLSGLPQEVHTPCLVFSPLDQVRREETPSAVVFLVNPDQLSALSMLANYDSAQQDNVKLLFGAGCVQSILYSLADEQAGSKKCTVGLIDPSARLCVAPELLSFSIPYSRFLELEAQVDESFLRGEIWQKLKKRMQGKEAPH